jgi:AcrR family transcriptional regulator
MGSSTTPPEPRKKPATRAGVDITEAILTAAETLIAEEGLARFTTNRLGELAGVSVGSLYQYFPNKEAVLAELARRLERRTQAQLLDVLERSADEPLAVVVERVVDVMIAGIGSTRFRRALREAVPSGWALETSAEVDATVRDRLHGELARRADVREGAYALMAWVVGHALEGAIEAMVMGDPAMLESPDVRRELETLVMAYLRR